MLIYFHYLIEMGAVITPQGTQNSSLVPGSLCTFTSDMSISTVHFAQC